MTKQEYTITVYTENQVGLLNRIAIIFSRRKINVESLNTSPSEVDSVNHRHQRNGRRGAQALPPHRKAGRSAESLL